MSAAADWAIAAIATKAIGGLSDTINNRGEAKRTEKINKYNARVVGERIKALNYEEAMNMTLRRLNAYSEIAEGQNTMSSSGNIGTSADSATMNAYLNLAGDLSAMSFNYENQRTDLKTEKKNYLYQANVAKGQKSSAVFGGLLGTAGTALASIAKGYSSGLFGSGK